MNGYIIAFLTIVTSAIGVYVAASFNLAQKQILAATRLNAYLTYWMGLVLELDAFNIFYLGQDWYESEQRIIADKGNAKDLLELESQRKASLAEVIAKVKEGAFTEMNTKMTDNAKRFPKAAIPAIYDAFKTSRQGMLDGTMFITDEEASYLGKFAATNAISLKMGIIEVMGGMELILTGLMSDPDSFDIAAYAEQMQKLLWKTIVISKEHCRLQRHAAYFTGHSLLRITIRNIKLGSRPQ